MGQILMPTFPPVHVIYPDVLGGLPGSYYVLNGGMLLILCLNCYWFYLILRMILRQIANLGKVEKDIRSDSD